MNRRKLLLGIAAALGAAYGLKAGGLGLGKIARKVGKHPALAMPYGDSHFAKLPEWANDDPYTYFCNKREWANLKAQGYDMHDCVLLGDIPSGKLHG